MSKKSFSLITVFIILPVLLLITACSQGFISPFLNETPQDEYTIDNLTGSDNATTKLDQKKLKELANLINTGTFGKIQSLVIIHNDNLQTFVSVTDNHFHATHATVQQRGDKCSPVDLGFR